MPEHVHLLIWPHVPNYDISAILWRIKRPVGKKAIALLRNEQPDWLPRLRLTHSDGTVERRFWQAGGGYDRNVVGPDSACQMADYMHLNPVRRGLAQFTEDWTWSSARWYAGLKDVPLEIDPTMPLASGDR